MNLISVISSSEEQAFVYPILWFRLIWFCENQWRKSGFSLRNCVRRESSFDSFVSLNVYFPKEIFKMHPDDRYVVNWPSVVKIPWKKTSCPCELHPNLTRSLLARSLVGRKRMKSASFPFLSKTSGQLHPFTSSSFRPLTWGSRPVLWCGWWVGGICFIPAL